MSWTIHYKLHTTLAVHIFLEVHELAALGTTLYHGTESDRETLLGHGGSSGAGFPCGVCTLPTVFPMTVHFVKAWKHDGSWRLRHNTHDKAHGEKTVEWNTAFILPCLRLHVICALLTDSSFHKLFSFLSCLSSFRSFQRNYFPKLFHWQDRWRPVLF